VAQADASNDDGVDGNYKRARAGEIICAALKRAGLNGQAAPLTRQLLDELDLT
jgi:hypothetical protein